MARRRKADGGGLPYFYAVPISDLHGGSIHHLLSPDTVFDGVLRGYKDGSVRGTFQPGMTSYQADLWETFTKHIANVKLVVGESPVVLIFAGDSCHGTRKQADLVTGADSLANQIRIVRDIFSYVVQQIPNVAEVVYSLGTEYHEGIGGGATDLLGQFVEKDHPEIRAVYGGHHPMLHIQGQLWDVAHHGPSPGIRVHLHGNNLRWYTRSIMHHALMNNYALPNVLLRGHFHSYTYEVCQVRAQSRTWRTHAFILPAYGGIDGYAMKSTKTKGFVTAGIPVLACQGERVLETYDGPEFVTEVDFRGHFDSVLGATAGG